MALRPCPFCGGTPYASPQPIGDKFAVICRKCKARGPIALTLETAMAQWRDHYDDTALAPLLCAARVIGDIEGEGGGSMSRVDEYRERWEAAIRDLCDAVEEINGEVEA